VTLVVGTAAGLSMRTTLVGAAVVGTMAMHPPTRQR
jgi:hypothetical protein